MFLLEVYHNNVTSILKSFGCNVSDILPFEKLIDHWKTFGTVKVIYIHVYSCLIVVFCCREIRFNYVFVYCQD